MAYSGRNNVIDEIKSRCNIVDVIGSVVSLRKTGANYVGLCPFHNEKTPSFVVSESKQVYTCYGCHEWGDVITFVEKYYNLSFNEAIEKLAAQCGVSLDENFGRSEKKDIYYEVNREAARFFYKALRAGDNPGLRYVARRGLKKETLHEFGIGYADGEWTSLYDHLKSKGYDEKVLLKLGLISSSKGKYYDKFRNRVIFPIQNTAGKVIGFGGRAIGDDMPKYLNSQETPVFSKKNNLYGLNVTKNYVNEEDCAILVEGYMDVISLYQGGVVNVAASLGTALTDNQVKLLKRYTKNIVLSYDADNAGINAAIRGSEILHKEGCKVRILHISEGKDPDDFIKAKGKLAYYKLVDEAVDYGDYRIEHIKKKHDTSTTSGQVDFLKECAAFLNTLSPVEADIYIRKVASNYNISETALRSEMGQGAVRTESVRTPVRKKKEKSDEGITKIEKIIIKVILTDSGYLKRMSGYDDIFASAPGMEIYKGIKEIYDENEEIDIGKLMEVLDPDDVEVLKEIDEGISLGGKANAIFEDCIRTHKMERFKKKEKEITVQIQIAEEQNNAAEAERLTMELMKLLKERSSLGGEN